MIRVKHLENDFFPGQGKVREVCGRSGKFGKVLKCQGISVLQIRGYKDNLGIISHISP